MDQAYQPLSAVDRARIAYEEMLRHKQAAANVRRLRAQSRAARVAIVCGAFIGLLVGCFIFYDLLPAPMHSRDDATFGKTRTGQVRSFVKGNICQELQFNNVSGGYVGGALVPCDTTVRKEATHQTSGQRVFSIRDAFAK
jgi:hypothetical protein